MAARISHDSKKLHWEGVNWMGYECAYYKYGTIYRDPKTKKISHVTYGRKTRIAVQNLADAIKRIDRYSNTRFGLNQAAKKGVKSQAKSIKSQPTNSTVNKPLHGTVRQRKLEESLEWRPHPKGGYFARYRLGTIIRIDGTYRYLLRYQQLAFPVKDLKTAMQKIDAYTRKEINELGTAMKNKPKKR